MDIIHLLSDNVANQIAAGEVIQRPCSVVKELVENSIDAGATSVTVNIKDAGRTLIEVIDDGKGMSDTDARMAFERHATSKISSAADLFTLTTLGFRGEALPSIAAVAQVVLTTRVEHAPMGTLIEISGSHIDKQEPCICGQGTIFKVRNLFFNVPARRKFLKSDETEMRNIVQEMHRIVLAHPDVAFKLYSNEELLFDLPVLPIKQRIVSLFNRKVKQIDQRLLPIEVSTELAQIRGFVGLPESAGKNSPQFFFVNNRYMYHPFFRKAITQAFDRMIAPDEVPCFFININVDPETIDVNIHPTKTEVKFENEREIWTLISLAVRDALGKFNIYPPIELDTEGKIESSRKDYNPNYNPFTSNKSSYNPFKSDPIRSSDWKPLIPGYDNNKAEMIQEEFEIQPQIQQTHEKKHLLLHNNIICLQMPQGLMLIDAQRAYDRIYYDEFILKLHSNDSLSQTLLFCDELMLIEDDVYIFAEIEEEFKSLGFKFSSVKTGHYNIEAYPSSFPEGLDRVKLINDIISEIKEGGFNSIMSIDNILCRNISSKIASFNISKQLSDSEVNTLIGKLFATTNPNFNPSGRKIISILDDQAISLLLD